MRVRMPIGVLVSSTLVFSALVALPTLAAAEEAAQESVTGVYGFTAVTNTGFKKGGTATIVDMGDTVAISTTLRNIKFKIPFTDIEQTVDVPINVEGDKVVIDPGRITIHVQADVGLAKGNGEITFTKSKKGDRWVIRGAGQGTSRWGNQGTGTLTGFSHSAGWKPEAGASTGSTSFANRALNAAQSAARWFSSSDPQPNPGILTSRDMFFIVLFAIALALVEAAVFSPRVPGSPDGSIYPQDAERPSSAPTEDSGATPSAPDGDVGSPAGSPD